MMYSDSLSFGKVKHSEVEGNWNFRSHYVSLAGERNIANLFFYLIH